MKALFAAALLAAVANGASAETITCMRFGQIVQCDRETSAGEQSQAPIDYLGALGETSTAAQRLADDQRHLRQRVGALVAAGHCDEAKAVALRAGDFDLAGRAQALCAPAN